MHVAFSNLFFQPLFLFGKWSGDCCPVKSRRQPCVEDLLPGSGRCGRVLPRCEEFPERRHPSFGFQFLLNGAVHGFSAEAVTKIFSSAFGNTGCSDVSFRPSRLPFLYPFPAVVELRPQHKVECRHHRHVRETSMVRDTFLPLPFPRKVRGRWVLR